MASLGLRKEAADVATNEGSNLLAKWKLALAVGVPVVAVLGVGWYLLRSEKKALVSNEKGSKRVGVAKVYPQRSESANSSPTKPPESKSDAAEAMGRRGNALYREGKYQEALKEYDAAVELCPANPKRELAILYRNRAACHEQLKNYQAVVEECTKALNLDPKYIKALVMRSKAWEQLDNLEEALVDITCSCILDGFQTQSSMATADRILKEVGLRKAKEHLSARKPVLPSNFFIQNYFSSFCEDPIRAEGDELQENSEEEGCNGETPGNHYIRALRALKCNNYEEVLKECDLELQSYDGKRVAAEGDAGTEEAGDECSPKALLLRGTMYLLMGDGPSTLRDLSACIEHQKATDKVRVNALVKRACQYLQDEKVDQCFSDFKRALKLGPSIADVYHHRGQVYMLLEKYDEAVSDFEKASALKPKFPPPQIQKCLAEYRRAFKEQDFNMIMESSEKFRTTVDKFPECADGFSIYAQILVDLQQFPQAEEYMDRAHKVTPQNAMILVHKGMLKIQARGDVNDAVSWIQKAIDVDEKCEYAYETLATIEVQRGNLEKAVQLFDKAIKLGKTELELTHLFSLREAAASQIRIKDTLGVSVTGALQMAATGAGL